MSATGGLTDEGSSIPAVASRWSGLTSGLASLAAVVQRPSHSLGCSINLPPVVEFVRYTKTSSPQDDKATPKPRIFAYCRAPRD